MQAAFARDKAFLGDVRSALGDGRCRLWWLGQSGFLLARDQRLTLFDPYLSDSLTDKYANTDKPHIRMTERVVSPEALGELGVIDLITSSHTHTDHLDARTLLPIFGHNPQARLVIPNANREDVVARLGVAFEERLRGLDHGLSLKCAGATVHGIAAAHDTVERDALGRCKFLGYVVRWENLTIYHSGDTLLHAGLLPALRSFSIDVALLPINGSAPERRVAGNMDGLEAARLACDVGVRLVIPCHFDMFAFNTASPVLFEAECERLGQSCRVLQNGEGLDL